jgi:hypothetical protein
MGDVFGPTVEFLTSPDDPDATFCVMRGVVPPGVVVPLHSHDDPEDFFIVAGAPQVLNLGDQGLRWCDAHAVDYVRVPAGTVPRAPQRGRPAIDLIITSARLGRFFREVGRPSTGPTPPPTPEELVHFVAVATKYGYMLGSPEDNAAVGIDLAW